MAIDQSDPVITPEMIEAGRLAMKDGWPGDPDAFIVRRVYIAMYKARHRKEVSDVLIPELPMPNS